VYFPLPNQPAQDTSQTGHQRADCIWLHGFWLPLSGHIAGVDEEEASATIRALALSQALKVTLEDGAHSLTPSGDFHAELERLIAEAKYKLGDD
jgi:hypothetical protein